MRAALQISTRNATARRRGLERVWGMGTNDARRKLGSTVATRQWSPRARRFFDVVRKIPTWRLAEVCGCSKDAAKLWRSGDRLPNWDHMAMLASYIPTIKAYVDDETEFESDRHLTESFAEFQRLLDTPGPKGDEARAFARQIAKRGG